MRPRFWGVRGSPTPQRDNLRYGGNTPCIKLRSAGGSIIIIDAGTGLRMLGKSVVWATHDEPGDARADCNLRELTKAVDVLIYDSQFLQDDLETEKKGCRHSSWEERVAICKEVGVKHFILFHHDPDSSDSDVDALQKKARSRFPHSRAAFEGMTLKP